MSFMRKCHSDLMKFDNLRTYNYLYSENENFKNSINHLDNTIVTELVDIGDTFKEEIKHANRRDQDIVKPHNKTILKKSKEMMTQFPASQKYISSSSSVLKPVLNLSSDINNITRSAVYKLTTQLAEASISNDIQDTSLLLETLDIGDPKVETEDVVEKLENHYIKNHNCIFKNLLYTILDVVESENNDAQHKLDQIQTILKSVKF